MGQESGVHVSHADVVDLDGDRIEDVGYEPLALLPAAALGELNANLQLSHGDRRYRDIIAVIHRLAQGIAPALGVNQDCRIQDQSCQGSVTGPKP